MDYISLLQKEMRPAFGCTEPIALAYAAAKAASVLDEFPNHIHARCSANILDYVYYRPYLSQNWIFHNAQIPNLESLASSCHTSYPLLIHQVKK